MVYSIAPIGGYDDDAVFRSKKLNEIYNFALQVDNLNEQKKDHPVKGVEISNGYEIIGKDDLLKLTSLDYVDFGEWADISINKFPEFSLIKREKNSDFVTVIFASSSMAEINNYINQ